MFSSKISKSLFSFLLVLSVQGIVANPSMQDFIKQLMIMSQEERDDVVIPLTQQFIQDGGDVNELFGIRFAYEDEQGNVPNEQELQENYGLDVNKQQTFVQIAALNGKPELVQLLLAHGAQPLLKSSEGDTAIDFAINGMGQNFYSCAISCEDGEKKFLGQIKGLSLLVAALSEADRKEVMSKLSVESIPDTASVCYDVDPITEMSMGENIAYDVLLFLPCCFPLVSLECEQLMIFYVETLPGEDQKTVALKMQGFLDLMQREYDYADKKIAVEKNDFTPEQLERLKLYESAKQSFERISDYVAKLK